MVILRADEVVSFCKPLRLGVLISSYGSLQQAVSVKFAFSRVEGNVGEPLQYQVAVASQAQKGAAPVELSVIRIAFEGVLEAVKLQNQVKPEKVPSKTADTVQVQDIELHETSSSEDLSSGSSSPTSESKAGLVGSADLSFSPGQMKIFKLTSIPRESGVTRAVSCTLFMEEKLFSLEYIVPLDDDRMSSSWWTRRKPGFAERSLGHEQLTSFKILPKPPKLEIQLRNVNSEYYTDESVILDIEIINNEDEQADAAIEVRLLGQFDGTPELSWGPTSPESHEVCPSSPNVGGSQTTHLSRRAIGGLAQAAKATEVVAFRAKSQPAEYVLEIRILYHLVSDPNTPLSKTLTTDIVLVSPFEANYDFTPRVYLDQWPSLFQVEDNRAPDKLDNKLASLADGITQRWCLSAGVASFAAESLTIEAMDVLVLGMNGGVTATITPEEQNGCSNLAIGSREQKEVRFTLDAQKLILEDRRSASLDLALNIRWRRPSQASELNTTSLSVPRLLIPAGEPRVLASLRYQVSGLPALVYVDYTFENPSMHFLTFNLAMEASEDFAFSGPKTTSLQMVPLSRHTIRYTLLPYVRGAWIQPQLKVVDMYFNKLLRISPTAGLKVDKKGLLIWVDTDA